MRRAEAAGKRAVQICNTRSMIHKFKFDADLTAIPQDADNGNTLLSVNPDVSAQLRGSGRQSGYSELVKPLFLCNVAHALTYGHNIGLLVDSDFPAFPFALIHAGRGRYFHESTIPSGIFERRA